MANFNLGNLVWKITADSAQFSRDLGSAQSQVTRFGQSVQQIGTNLTKFVTLPIAGAATAAVKFASDLQESTNAVNVVFGESARIITDWGTNAAEQAGLSQASFNGLATQVGVLLQQTGQDFDTVADNTINLTQRAADLASIYNTDVTDAVNALGAALRGESEPARRYGVLLSEAAVQAKGLELGLGGLNGELTEAEKVQARYQIILDSTNNVAGDFARTNGDVANSFRVTRAQIENTAAQIGTALLPVVGDVLNIVRDWTSELADLDEEQIKTIITTGAVVASIGPLLSIVGTAIVTFGQLKVAIAKVNATALFGPLGLIAGVTAATVALGLLVNSARNREIDEFAESVAGVAEELGLTTRQAEDFAEQLLNLEKNIETFEQEGISLDIEAALRRAAEQAGLTVIEFSKLIVSSDNVSDNLRATAQNYVDIERRAQSVNVISEQISEWSQLHRDNIQAQNQALQEQQSAIEAAETRELSRVQGIIEARRNLERETQESIRVTQALRDAGVIEQEEAQSRIESAYRREIELLLELGYTLDTGGQIGQDRLRSLIELLKGMQVETEVLTDVTTQQYLDFIGLEQQLQLEKERTAQIAQANADAAKRQAEEQERNLRQLVDAGLTPVFQGFQDIGQAIFDNADISVIAGRVVLQSLASILRALGAELAARASIALVGGLLGKVTDFAAIAPALLGSAAAFTAAGLIDAAASSIGGTGGGSAPRTQPSAPATPRPSDTGASRASASGTGGGDGGVINFTQNNIVNLDTDENLGKAARILFPALKAEGIRRGENL